MTKEIPNFGPIPQDTAFRAVLETQVVIMDALDMLVLSLPDRIRPVVETHELLDRKMKAVKDLLAIYRGGEEKPAEPAKPEPANRWEAMTETAKSFLTLYPTSSTYFAQRKMALSDMLKVLGYQRVSDIHDNRDIESMEKFFKDWADYDRNELL